MAVLAGARSIGTEENYLPRGFDGFERNPLYRYQKKYPNKRGEKEETPYC